MSIAALAVMLALAAATAQPATVVQFVAVDVSGKPVATPREELELKIDGVTVPIEDVSAARSPLSLLLVIDSTYSVGGLRTGAPVWLGSVTQAFEAVVKELGAEDRAAIVPLSGVASARLTNDRGELRRQLRSALDRDEEERSGPSPIWDAAAAAVERLRNAPGIRGAIVFTDGLATANRLGRGDAADLAALAGVSLNFVAVGGEYMVRQGRDVAALVRPSIFLEQVAGFTGGACLKTVHTRARETAEAFRQVIARLRATRDLTFHSPVRDGRPHRLEIRASAPGVTIQARRAFIAPR